MDVVAWVHATDGHLLAVRTRGRDRLYLPGGKRESGEDDWATLSREVREELGVDLDRNSVRALAVVEADTHDQPLEAQVRMTCFTAGYIGELQPGNEVDEFVFVSKDDRHLLAPASQAALDAAVRQGVL